MNIQARVPESKTVTGPSIMKYKDMVIHKAAMKHGSNNHNNLNVKKKKREKRKKNKKTMKWQRRKSVYYNTVQSTISQNYNKKN